MKAYLLVTAATLCISGSFALVGCSNPAEAEVTHLQSELSNVTAERDKLKAELTVLKQTDNYFYQQAVDARKKGDLAGSTTKARDVLQRFPKTGLRKDIGQLIQQNQNDVEAKAFREGLTAFETGSHSVAQSSLARFLATYPSSKYAGRARDLKRRAGQRIAQEEVSAQHEAAAQAERDLRAGAKLELVSWHWGQSDSEDWATAEGRVKNISDEPLQTVEAVVQFNTSGGELITTDSAVIDYNPILPGQTSAFKVMARYNPAMKTAELEFKELLGGTIPTYRKK